MRKLSHDIFTMACQELPSIQKTLQALKSVFRKIKAKPKFSLDGIVLRSVELRGVELFMEVITKNGSCLHVRNRFEGINYDHGKLTVVIYSNAEHNLCADPGMFKFTWSSMGSTWWSPKMGTFKRLYVRRIRHYTLW